MIFRLKSDTYFEAKNLDDAFGKLINHFCHLQDDTAGYPAIEFLVNSEMELHPVDPPMQIVTTTTTSG